MKIIVPTLGRAGKISSLEWLEKTGREVILVTEKEEYALYRGAHPHFKIECHPTNCNRSNGRMRKSLLTMFPDPHFQVDDDIHLMLKDAKTYEEAFDRLECHINHGAPIAGFGMQLFSNFAMKNAIDLMGDRVILNKFVATVYGIDPQHFKECPLEGLAVYEDVALVIHAIQQGGSVVSYAATHTNISPKEGGCSSWRTKELTLECLDKLISLYPNFCSKRKTKMSTHSQDIGVGLRVSWSKINETFTG